MRNFTNYTIATLFAATLLATPVLANDTGHHSKQAEPGYWTRGSVQSNETVQPASNAVPALPVAQQQRRELQPSAHRHGFARAPIGTEDTMR